MYRRLMFAVLMVFILTGVALAAVTFQLLPLGTTTAILTANSLGSGGFTATSATYNNTIGQTGNGHIRCRFETLYTFGGPAAFNAATYIWILESLNGTNFADAPNGSNFTTVPSLVIPVTANSTTTRQTGTTWCPPGQFRVIAQLANTGQTTTGSGNVVNLQPFTIQGN